MRWLFLLLFPFALHAQESLWTLESLEPDSIVRSLAPLSVHRRFCSSDPTSYRFTDGTMLLEREVVWHNNDPDQHGRDACKCSMQIHHPSGGNLVYLPRTKPHLMWVLRHESHFCNTGRGEMSGRTSPKMTTVTYQGCARFLMKRPDGEEALYHFPYIKDDKEFYKESSCQGQLSWRRLPNGMVLDYTDEGVSARTSTGKELGWLTFNRTDSGLEVSSSDGQRLFYELEDRRIKRIEAPGRPWIEWEETTIKRPEGRYLELVIGDYKVKEIWGPHGPSSERVRLAEFRYGKDRTAVRDAHENVTRYYYDKGKRLTQVTHPDGSRIRFTYGHEGANRGNLLRKVVCDPNPVVLSHYKYDLRGNVVEERLIGNLTGECEVAISLGISSSFLPDPPRPEEYAIERVYPQSRHAYENRYDSRIQERIEFGKRTSYSYLGETDLVTVERTFANGTQVFAHFFEYDEDNFLIRERLSSGLTTTIERDELGFPLRVEQLDRKGALLSAVEYEYDRGLVIVERHFDARGDARYSIERKYDEGDRLIYESDPIGRTFEWAYDANGNCILEKGPKGTFEHSYDKANRKIETKWGERLHRYLYNELSQCVEEIDWLGRSHRRRFDAMGRVVEERFPNGATRQYRHSALGCVEEVDELGGVTHRTFTARGQPIRMDYPDGTFERRTYDLKGRLVRLLDQEGVVHKWSYDPLDRLLRLEVGPKVWSYSYDGELLTSMTDPTGLKTSYTYDAANRLTVEERGRRRIEYTYDEFGRQKSRKEGRLQRWSYDLLGRVVEEWDGDVCTKYTYDDAGNQTSVLLSGQETKTLFDPYHRAVSITDPAGRTTTIEYNENQQRTTDPLGQVTIESFDEMDRLVRSERGDRCIEYSYDLVGNLLKERHGEGFEVSWVYDDVGRWTQVGETTLLYNRLGQLSCRILADGTRIEFHYDDLGRLIREGKIDYAYDLADRLIRAGKSHLTYDLEGNLICEVQASGFAIQYEHDDVGRVTKVTLPDGSCIDYAYSPDHLTSISRGDHSVAFTFDQYGRLQLEGDIEYIWDEVGELMGIESPTYSTKLEYDCVGRLIADGSHRFRYDEFDQLVEEEGGVYEYDLLCNRISSNGAPWEVDEKNRLLSTGHFELAYDELGNVKRCGDAALTFDERGRLIAYSRDGAVHEYEYDAFDRRIAKRSGGETRFFLYDGLHEIAEFNESGEIVAFRVLGGDQAVLLEIEGKSYRPVHNVRGDLIQLLTPEGDLAQECGYTSFGVSSGRFSSPWRFQGKRLDPESGWLYFGARYYAPELGRWISPDPLGYDEGPNLYAYVYNNPWNLFDPFGLQSEFRFDPEIFSRLGRAELGHGYLNRDDPLLSTIGSGKLHGLCDFGLSTAGFFGWCGLQGMGIASGTWGSSSHQHMMGRCTEMWGNFRHGFDQWMATSQGMSLSDPLYQQARFVSRAACDVGTLCLGAPGLIRSGLSAFQYGKKGLDLFRAGRAVAGASSEVAAFIPKIGELGMLAGEASSVGRGALSAWTVQGNRFHYAAFRLSETGQRNIRVLRNWAHSKGWIKGSFPAGTPERWGIYGKNGFEWRLRIKPEPTLRFNIHQGSQTPRFDARLDKGGQMYTNPFTGEIGGAEIGTHLPL